MGSCARARLMPSKAGPQLFCNMRSLVLPHESCSFVQISTGRPCPLETYSGLAEHARWHHHVDITESHHRHNPYIQG